MENFNEIKEKLDNYSLDSYNVNQGWGKLQKSGRNKRHRLVSMIVGVAAACLLVITGYWLLHEKMIDSSHHEVAVSKILMPDIYPSITPDTSVESIVKNHESRLQPLLKRIPYRFAKTRGTHAPTVQQVQSSREAVEPGEQIRLMEKDADTENLPAPVIVRTEDIKNKPLEILSEEQLLDMISVVNEIEPKQSKLKEFLASKGEQKEYTTEKYSSGPSNISQTKF